MTPKKPPQTPKGKHAEKPPRISAAGLGTREVKKTIKAEPENQAKNQLGYMGARGRRKNHQREAADSRQKTRQKKTRRPEGGRDQKNQEAKNIRRGPRPKTP